MVNARRPQVINGTRIPPHIPTLRIAASDLEVNGVSATTENSSVLEWELHGCKIELVDALGELQHDETFECCIPHLKALTPDTDAKRARVTRASDRKYYCRTIWCRRRCNEYRRNCTTSVRGVSSP